MTIRKHGYITPKQVLSFFKDMGETYTQKEVDNLIFELDIKGIFKLISFFDFYFEK